jgi:hypothetical protein
MPVRLVGYNGGVGRGRAPLEILAPFLWNAAPACEPGFPRLKSRAPGERRHPLHILRRSPPERRPPGASGARIPQPSRDRQGAVAPSVRSLRITPRLFTFPTGKDFVLTPRLLYR